MTETSSTIVAKPRTLSGKGPARRLRASGWVPAIAYGPKEPPKTLALEPKIFETARRRYGGSFIYDVSVEGGQGFKALVKAIDVDPITRALVHVDLYAVDMEKPIRVKVPLRFTGKPVGVKEGGLFQGVLRRVEIQCLPALIPEHIDVAIDDMKMGDTLHLSDLELPEGVKATAVDDQAVAILSTPDSAGEETAKSEGEEDVAASAGDK